MEMKWGRSFVAVLLTTFVLTAGSAFAEVDDLAKQADKILRDAEKMMFSGKNAEADALLNEAGELIEQGKAEDPNNKKILQTEKKFTRIRNNVDKKLGKLDAKPASSEQGLPPKPEPKAMPTKSSGPAVAAKTAATDKLPAGVTKRLKDITRLLDSAERYVGSNAESAKYNLQQAAQFFGEIEKNYGGQFDPANPQFAAVQNRFEELNEKAREQGAAESKAKADAVGAKAAQEQQSAEWVARFREYLSYPGQEGHNPDMLVFVPGTSEPEKFAEAQKRCDAFKVFYEEYKKTEFPNGKTWQLEELADREAPLRLKSFEEGFASRVESVTGDAEKEIAAAMAQLEKDNGWKSDKTIKPNLVDHKWMTSIREITEKVTAALGESDPKRKEIQAEFDALVAKDQENRRIRKERTFMTPDRYTGGDMDELKKKAETLVKNDKKDGGDPLRCTIISENWQEQTVEEWTDTTKTAWRRRTTRSITAQVAAKTSDGARLITVALAKDKQSDGSWSALYGNLHQYFDPMLESNVNK
ncbi:MAG: hypothetical protein KQJ78_25620 [Deltaproteobacteria bacterium]|nr:hypothetical protein [Deltaproteobacteria bacterium]